MTESENIRFMPTLRHMTHTSPRTVGELLSRLQVFQEDPSAVQHKYPWATRFVCGVPLAPWQRPIVWNDAMQSRFIDALWRNVDVGSYMVNAWWEMVGDNSQMAYLSDIVLDGQQRLTSLERYFLDEIPATAADGSRMLWSQISVLDRRFFQNCLFSRTEINTHDELVLREAYDIRAFSGVRHTEDQRALPLK